MPNTSYLKLSLLGIIALAGAMSVVGTLPARTAHAMSIAVTKTADTNDGTCDSDCSLREAVILANATVGHDNIQIPAGTYTLTGATGEDASASGDLDVTDSVSFNGSGMTTTIINGGSLENVLDVKNGAGTLILTDLTVRDGNGFGIASDATDVNIVNTLVSSNNGDGILTGAGNVDLLVSTVDNNNGIGIQTSSGNVTLDRSTVSRNNGHGISTTNGNVTLTNSTVSDNNGGGILTQDGDIHVNWSTIANNNGNGVEASESGLILLSGAIIANNDSDACFNSVEASDHSLDTDGSCGLTGTGDISDGSADLGPLQNNGGTTETLEPQAGSDAIDAGGDGCPEDDQRQLARPVGAACDIGAVEVQGAQPTPTVCIREQCPTATKTVVRIKTHTPTVTRTPEATNTPVPTSTRPNTPAPEHTGGREGIVRGPDTGSSGSANGASGGFALAVTMLALAGAVLTAGAVWRRRA